MWFAEVRSPLGRWTPVVFAEDPRSNRYVRDKFRREPVELHPHMRDLPLSVVARILGVDGDLRNVPLEPLLDFLHSNAAELYVKYGLH